jgi:hypothetical protein
VRADPSDGIANGIGRTTVAGESVRELFRRHGRDGKYALWKSIRQDVMIAESHANQDQETVV